MPEEGDKLAWDELCQCELECWKVLEQIAEHSALNESRAAASASCELHGEKIKKIRASMDQLEQAEDKFFHAVLTSNRKHDIESDIQSVKTIEDRLCDFIRQVIGIKMRPKSLDERVTPILLMHQRSEGPYPEEIARIWGQLNENSRSRETFTRRNINQLREALAHPATDEPGDIHE